MNILITEDNGVYRKLLCAMVERITGQLPKSAVNGEDALSMARKESFDVIFMDNHMPILGGILATQKIRESFRPNKQPYIVAVTGTSDSKELKGFEDAGINDLLSKPFGLADLEEVLKKATAAMSIATRAVA